MKEFVLKIHIWHQKYKENLMPLDLYLYYKHDENTQRHLQLFIVLLKCIEIRNSGTKTSKYLPDSNKCQCQDYNNCVHNFYLKTLFHFCT